MICWSYVTYLHRCSYLFSCILSNMYSYSLPLCWHNLDYNMQCSASIHRYLRGKKKNLMYYVLYISYPTHARTHAQKHYAWASACSIRRKGAIIYGKSWLMIASGSYHLPKLKRGIKMQYDYLCRSSHLLEAWNHDDMRRNNWKTNFKWSIARLQTVFL